MMCLNCQDCHCELCQGRRQAREDSARRERYRSHQVVPVLPLDWWEEGYLLEVIEDSQR